MTDRPSPPLGYVLLTNEEYQRLCDAAALDDMLIWCDTCGAWIDRDDEAAASTDDFKGCWKAATRDSKFDHTCRSWRAPR